MSEPGPAAEYLEALAGELRVGSRYRRRALAEIAAHIDEVVERERRIGASAWEAERIAIRRLGAVQTVAEGFSRTRRETITLARACGLRAMAYLSAALVVACAALARLATGEHDTHFGLEAAAAIAAALAVMLIDGSPRGSTRVGLALVGVIALWIAIAAALVSDGEVAYCGFVLGSVVVSAALVRLGRRLRFRPRRSES